MSDQKHLGGHESHGGRDDLGPVARDAATARHTPGPWKWFDYPDGRKLLVAPACAVIHCPDAPMEVAPPDAHLIAAAPELYGCLRGLLALPGVREAAQKSVFGSLVYNADAALAKAEGR